MLAIFVAGAVLGFLPLYWIVSRRSPPAKPQASGKVFSLFKQEEKPRLFETLAASDDWVVIDLETTGIKRSSEIIEVSICKRRSKNPSVRRPSRSVAPD